MSLEKSTIVSLNGNMATVRIGGGMVQNKALEIPRGADAAVGDYAYLAQCGKEYVIVAIQRKRGV